jgi:hypothetical protein
MMQQKPALYKAHVGVAWIFDILKGGRKKYPATNNNAVKIKALINLLLSFIGLSILKNNNDNTIPLNVEMCVLHFHFAHVSISASQYLLMNQYGLQ